MPLAAPSSERFCPPHCKGYRSASDYASPGTAAPAFWGSVGAFATLIPFVGNALVWLPAVAAPAVRRDLVAALVMLVFGKVVPSLIDRVTRAEISKRVGKTHPLIVLAGTLVGLRLAGPIGVLIGPALVQCSFAVVRLFEREYGLPWTARTTYAKQ
jgi:predicted PurR-regulated permease PerM